MKYRTTHVNDVDLRKMTGDEAVRYLSGLGVTILTGERLVDITPVSEPKHDPIPEIPTQPYSATYIATNLISFRGPVSILLNTIDRYDLTVKCIGQALATAGWPYELLVCDNSSTDKRVIEYIESLNPVYFRKNNTNEGCAQMHNQMLLRASSTLYVLLDNDIEIKCENWLRQLVYTYEAVPNSGVVGIFSECLNPDYHNAEMVEGISIRPAKSPKEDAVFGTRMFSKYVLDKVGYFCEDYGKYAYCDNEYNSRVYHSGFINYYLDGPMGYHHGTDIGEDSDYRKMKDTHLKNYGPVLVANMKRYFDIGSFYVPPPELR